MSCANSPVDDLGFARIDHQRAHTSGLSRGDARSRQNGGADRGDRRARLSAAGTRCSSRAPTSRCYAPSSTSARRRLSSAARAITCRQRGSRPGRGTVLVVDAGTADLPVAEEAAVTAELMGNRVERLYDVGVAGLHRLLREHDRLQQARVIIVVAGMEGALPSVVSAGS